jgi:hypothetical protein
MPNLFISYRRDDAIGLAGRIYDRLQAHFGRRTVFMDVDSIPFGVDFRQHLGAVLDKCDALVSVIGEQWAGPTPQGTRRVDDPNDFVRIEVETALARGIPVVPILVGRTSMPRPEELPASLANLAYRNAIQVDPGRDFHHHMDQLIQTLDEMLPKQGNVPAPAAEGAEHAGPATPVRPLPQPVVEIVSGPEKGKTYPLVKDRVLLGRSADADISFSSLALSRYQAQFVRTPEGYALEDLQSSNGSYVNGQLARGRVPLKHGDHIHTGNVILIYRTEG